MFLSDTDSIENAHTRIPSNSVKGVTIILFGVEVENECHDWYIDDCGLYLRGGNEIECRKDNDVEIASTRLVEMECLRVICMEDVKNMEPRAS
jgi:hypothetical protein